MSQSYIDRSQQNNTSITPDETTQKKIDPVAQLKWLNSQNGDQGFGIYGDNLPAGRANRHRCLPQTRKNKHNVNPKKIYYKEKQKTNSI